MIDRPVVVLPQPDSPTTPEALALVDVEGDVVDGHHRRPAQTELGAQPLDLEDRGHLTRSTRAFAASTTAVRLALRPEQFVHKSREPPAQRRAP